MERSLWLFILPGGLLVGLMTLPVLALVWRAVSSQSLAAIAEPMALAALRLSLVTSTISTAVVLLAGTPLAYMLARWSFRGRRWVELLVDLPIVLPPSVAGLALLLAFGRRGLLGAPLAVLGVSLPFTTAAVVIAQAFVAGPLYIRAARIGFATIDRQLEEAAYTEGANQWQLFRFVMLPLTFPAILGGVLLCWTRALGEFGATILFAGNLLGRTQTMPLAIYIGFERNLGVAMALSTLLLLVSAVFLALLRRLERG
ncbi:MAG: ABC transporter permease [Chloroflexi bacterium]|nr:ABC transporter permease [Chloroflexota bacterium]MCI0578445.1 ABC transporter permease [Chloroflexota bacterium]MCI0643891.1 ABC transporter permease [Chloroflexota bacterium]MCI0729199.1 ABC transporter permease [Chloroflexota bacterium]